MKQKVTRFALTLLVSVLTATTAWAQDPTWLKSGDSWDATTKTLTVNTAEVAQNAYRNRSEIENVIISNGVTSIGSAAFAGCTNLKTVFVGNGVTSIGDGAFYSGTNLKTVIVSRTSSAPNLVGPPFSTSPNLKIYVPVGNNGKILPDYQQSGWYSYRNYLVGSWMSGTCALALNNCVMTVDGFTMADTDPVSRGWQNSIGNITSVVIEDGVTSIGEYAFSGCGNLETITIPASVTSIGDGAFYRCGSLATITVDANNQVFDSREGCNAIIRKADNTLILGCKNTSTIPDGVTSIGASAFFGCSGLTAISIPDGVQSIGDDAFSGCANLESVHIGSGVSSIAESAFSGCGNLASITVDEDNQAYDSPEGSNAIIRKGDNTLILGCKTTVIPASVTSIGDQAFYGCGGLTTVSIPDGVQSIGISAFYSCNGLSMVTIGSGVTSIGDGAFASCDALESVTIYATSVPTLGSDVFWGNKSGRKIFVPTASLSDYKAAWGMYANDILPVDWEGAYAGTEDDPYMIYSTDHLLKLAYRVKGTHGETANDYENKYFKLGADIAFTYDPNETDDYDENYEAIGGYYNSDIRKFNGNFNGDGHTVSGIRLRKTGTDIANDYQGLFGEIGSNAIIHDVHVTDARIKGRLCVGGIVGYSYKGTVRNCTVTESNITATNDHYGTICGFNSQGIFSHNYYRHCTVNGTANATNVGCMGADITDTQGAIPAFLVTLGDDATIETAMAADLGFSYGGKNYWRTGAELTLGHANRDGYAFIGYTVTDAGSNPVSVTENNDVYTFTMPASDVTVTANLIEKIPYIDENGKTVDCTNYTVLNNTMTTISAGWYVVKSNVEFSDDLSTNVSSWVDNTVNIILCDGATLTANNITPNTNNDRLCIYGQSRGTGTANISGNIMGNYSISIYGGTINATGNITCPQGGIGIYGGTVTAGSLVALNTGSQIRLGGATVTADSYQVTNGNVTIDTGKTYYDGTGAFYTAGNLDADQITAITGKTLVPVTLSGTCGVDDPATGDVDESQNVTWLYDISTHTLTISGTGDMAEYASANDVPWATYKVNITTAAISAGVTTINSCAFNQGTIINLSYTGSVPDGYSFGGYTVTDAGSNPVSVTGNNGVYTFTMPDEDVTITVTLKKLMTNNDITITIPSQTWTGIELTPVITVKDGETTLTENTDYTVTAPSGPIQDAGNYTYTINGMGNYAGSKEATFTILPSTVVVNVTGNGTVTYNDKVATNGEVIGVVADKGTDVTLTLAPESGYAVSVAYGYTKNSGTTAIGRKLPISGTTATLTVPNDLKDGTYVNLTVTFVSALVGGADEVSAVALTDNTVTDLAGGWYKVDSDITFDHTLNLLGDTHLIIDDGKTMTVNTATSKGILSDYTLFVISKGALNVATTDNYGIAVRVGNYVQTGATVTASGYIGIRCKDDFLGFDFDNDFTFSGGQLTATGNSRGIRADNNITLSCTNATDFIQASSYRSVYGAVKIADGKALTDGTEASNGMNGYSGTLTNEQITAIGGKTLHRAVTTSYVEASGTLHENVIAIPLDNTMTTLAAGWYVVNSDVAYTGTVTLSGDVKLILGDGCTMSFGTEGEPLDATIMDCQNHNLTIYGQSGGTGWLKAYSAQYDGIKNVNYYTQNSGNVVISDGNGACIKAGEFTILGGTLDLKDVGGANGEIVTTGDINIRGGKLWAWYKGLKTMHGKIILDYTNATDQISVKAYNPQNGLQIADGKTLVDDYGVIWSGALNNNQIEHGINNRTLKPVMGVTLMKEGNNVSATFSGLSETTVSIPVNVNVTSVTYNRAFTMDKPSTVMLPFSKDVNEIGGGTFYTFGGVEKKNNKWVATMNEVTGSLTANTPYLFVPAGTSLTFTGGATLNTTGGGNCLASDAVGWVFHGTYERKVWDEVETHDYGFAAVSGKSADNQDVEAGQFVRLTLGASAKPMRCYLSYVGGPNQARALTRGAAATDEELPSSIIVRLVGANGQTTGIGTLDTKTGEMIFDSEAWYTLDGVRLSGKPTKKGLYINNGKKIVIK